MYTTELKVRNNSVYEVVIHSIFLLKYSEIW